MTLLLLDAHSLLHATTSLPIATKLVPSTGPCSHQPIGGAYLFTRALFSFLCPPRKHPLSSYAPLTCIAVFDGGRAPWRTELLQTYKSDTTTPKPCPTFELNRHLLLKQVLPALHIPTFVSPQIEADDAIAYLALHAPRTAKVIIVSADQDYDTILRPPHLIRYDHRTKRLITQRVSTLYKCLIGCASDSVPGIGGVGPRRAQQLLTNPFRLRSNLTPQQRANLRRNFKLISLRAAARRLAPEIKSVLNQKLREVLSAPPFDPNALPPEAVTLFRSLEWTSLLSKTLRSP